MTKHTFNQPYHEFFEYHGNTTVERVTTRGSGQVTREWIIFDSVEEAQDFFNNDCIG